MTEYKSKADQHILKKRSIKKFILHLTTANSCEALTLARNISGFFFVQRIQELACISVINININIFMKLILEYFIDRKMSL